METGKDTARRTLGIDIRLRDAVDVVEDDFLIIDNSYRIKFANAAVRRKFSQGNEDLIGRLCYEVLHGRDTPCSTPLLGCPHHEVMGNGSISATIHTVRTHGTTQYLKITAYPLRDSNGAITAVVELRRDVTAERELETQILKRHHQLLALSHISRAIRGLNDLDAILKIALDNVLEIINGAIGGILLLDEDTKTLSYRVQRGLSPRYVAEIRMSLGQGIAGRVAQSGEPLLVEDVSKDPRTAHPDLVSGEGLKGFVSIPLKAKNKVAGVMNVASHLAGRFGADDVSLLNSIGDYLGTAIEQAKLYERLNKGKERYQTLLARAITIQEEERKRIARELHDDTGQSLTALSLNMQAISEMMEMSNEENDDIKALLKRTHSIAVHAGGELTRLIRELRPTLLDTLGLSAALRNLAESNLASRGIEVTTEFKGLEKRLPTEMELALLRITQEAINNIVRHSEAKKAAISLERNDKECILCVEDDGKGFDVGLIKSIDPTGRGAGLFGMKERVTLVGGKCAIDSQPGKGTKIVAKVPIPGSTNNAKDKSVVDR